jgi:DNA-binding transcriptional MerR regulator
MTPALPDVTIPERPAFKAAEVCDIAKLQPYVLRSWESEFPDLGVAKTPGGPRIYRKADVERVLRIRALVFGEGLTLAGVRRRLESEALVAPKEPPPEDATLFQDVIGADLKARLAQIKAGLRGLLELVSRDRLSSSVTVGDFHLEAPSAASAAPAHAPSKRPTRRKADPA